MESSSVLHAIGDTSIVRLRRVTPPRCAAIYVKLEWENPHRQHEGSHGASGDRKRRGRRTAETRRDGRRIHRREHRRRARSRLRRQRLSHSHRQLRRLQPRETRPHGGAGRRVDDCAERGRPHDQEAHSRHDRSGSAAQPRAGRLLDQSALQSRQRRRVSSARRGDLAADRGGGRRVRPLRRNGCVLARNGDGFEAPQAGGSVRRRRAGRISVLLAARRGRITSRASGSAMRRRFGTLL